MHLRNFETYTFLDYLQIYARFLNVSSFFFSSSFSSRTRFFQPLAPHERFQCESSLFYPVEEFCIDM